MPCLPEPFGMLTINRLMGATKIEENNCGGGALFPGFELVMGGGTLPLRSTSWLWITLFCCSDVWRQVEYVPKTLGKRWSLIFKNELARERRQPSKGKGIGWARERLATLQFMKQVKERRARSSSNQNEKKPFHH
ncbi:unnamed protein product [Prunus armeniaca]